MRSKIKEFFESLFTQDMGRQARQVEVLTIIVFIILLFVIGFLWQYKVVDQLNIFELLLSKR
jgi:hypothetical protein